MKKITDRPNRAEPADSNTWSDEESTPGSAGHPELGSGHDESKTTTVEDGPPRRPAEGVPGAFGGVETDRRP
jgi:hypothetical protein